MAKRYHQSKMDRMHEERGMERHLRGPVKSHMDPRRHEEMREAGMIREDHSKIANMPQEVMFKPWPSSETYVPEQLDDTIYGINAQMKLDDAKRSEYFAPKKV